ncbi:hypothetical protein PTKIN_Ptkin05aG0074000 [Pterospermum kingtungense]
MWSSAQAFRMCPIHRKEFPENLKIMMKEEDFPELDVFICTADPYKEPPMNVANTALSLMAYDYPTDKISVYVSDDGRSAWTLFAFTEAAKFANYWLPFCREYNIMERSPQVYIASNYHCGSPEMEKIKMMYENMKEKVQNVVDKGHISDENVTNDQQRQAFSKWTNGFTRSDHPTVIQKSKTSPNNFKAGALNELVGFRCGTLVEDFHTGYRLQCEGWKGIFCNPYRAAFLGDMPITLFDVPSQCKRWCIGLLEVTFSKYNTFSFGSPSMGLLMGLGYSHYALWPIWCIPVTFYSFIPQLALINKVSNFPKISEPWFLLYVFLFLGAYGQDFLDYVVGGGTAKRWWNAQRISMIRGLTCYLFSSVEYLFKPLGISAHGFSITSKVVDDEQSKRYEHSTF